MLAFVFRLGVLAICALLGLGFWAQACSPQRDYIRETSFELVDLSDAIVIAEAVKEVEGGAFGPDIRFKIIETIKGNPPEILDVTYGYLKNSIPSDPKEISAPHPDSLRGSCNRTSFAKDAKYVLMLKQAEDGSWRMFGGPFTRRAEDYHGPESYWARAIAVYLDIQENPDRMAQLDALYPLWKDNRDADEGSFERALADDINIHFWSLSWRKPTAYLVRIYESLEAALVGAEPARAPRESSILDALKGDAERGLSPPPEEDLHRVRLSILRQLHLGSHAGAAELVNRVVDNNPSAEELSSAMLFFSAIGARERGIHLFQTKGWSKVATGSKRESSMLYEAFLSFAPTEDEAADTEYAEWWAEIALAINQMRRVRFGHDWGLGTAAEILRPDDYSQRPFVTLSLARAYDEDVQKWAETEIWALIGEGADAFDDQFQLPVQVLLEAFYPPEPEEIDRLLCHAEVGRYVVVKYLGLLESGWQSEKLIERILTIELDEVERENLISSLSSLVGGEWSRLLVSDKGWGADKKLLGLLSRMHKGEWESLASANIVINCPEP